MTAIAAQDEAVEGYIPSVGHQQLQWQRAWHHLYKEGVVPVGQAKPGGTCLKERQDTPSTHISNNIQNLLATGYHK